MLRMLIFMGIPAALVFGVCYYLVYAGAIGLCDRLVSGEHEEIRRITSDLYVASVNTAPVIEENLDRPDKIQEIINRMLRKNPYMRSCGISFVENYYPKKGRWFCPFAVRVDSDSIETYVMGDAKHDYLNEAWLSLDWLNDKIQFFRAKTDSTRKKSVTIRYDLDKEGKWDPEYAAYYFLVDTTGTLLVHPDQKRVLKHNIKEYVSEDPNDAIGGLLDRYSDEEDDVIIDGERILLSFMPVKYTDWCLALVIPAFIVELIAYIFGGVSILITQNHQEIHQAAEAVGRISQRGGQGKLRHATARAGEPRRDTPAARLVRADAALADQIRGGAEEHHCPESIH